LLVTKAAEWMPLWLNEGLAEFYQNSDIREKDVSLSIPNSANFLQARFWITSGWPTIRSELASSSLSARILRREASPIPSTHAATHDLRN
jgi:hypothetical protein